jgi:hypothetical protein
MGRIGNEGRTKPVEPPLEEEAELSAATVDFASALAGATAALPGPAALGAEDAAANGTLPSLEPPAAGRKLLEMKKYAATAMATAPSKAKLNRPFMEKFWRTQRVG